MRPDLIDFKDDGRLYIDKSVYALAEMAELIRVHGKHYVDLLARLYMYRTPINPFDPADEREARALSDCQTLNKCSLDPTILDSPEWKAAKDRFNKEKFDTLADAYVNFATKIDEFNQAISTTPVSELIESSSVKPKRGKQPVGDSDPNARTTYRHDNTDLLKNMATTLALYQKQNEEQRKDLLRQREGKKSTGQRASDFKNF